MAAVMRNHRGRQLLTMLPTILEDGDHQSLLIGIEDKQMNFKGSGAASTIKDIEESLLGDIGTLHEEDQDGITRSSVASWNIFLGCTATVYLGLLVCIFSIASTDARFDRIHHYNVFGTSSSQWSMLDAAKETYPFMIHSPSYDTIEADFEIYAEPVASAELLAPTELMASSMPSNDTLLLHSPVQSLHLSTQDNEIGLDDWDNDPEHLTIYDSDEEFDYYSEQSSGKEPATPTFHHQYA
jgi:hypothetical protein